MGLKNPSSLGVHALTKCELLLCESALATSKDRAKRKVKVKHLNRKCLCIGYRFQSFLCGIFSELKLRNKIETCCIHMTVRQAYVMMWMICKKESSGLDVLETCCGL